MIVTSPRSRSELCLVEMRSLACVTLAALGGSMLARLILPAALALAALPAGAQEVTRSYPTPTAVIAGAVTVPSGFDTVYLSGVLPDPITPAGSAVAADYGTTEQQTGSVLTKLAAALKAQGLTEGDVVKMTVFLAGDPAQGGRMDFAGMMRAYGRHYGTPAQPNRPARSTVQVAALVFPTALVEIEVIAARRGGAIVPLRAQR